MITRRSCGPNKQQKARKSVFNISYFQFTASMSYREREGKPYCDHCYTGGQFPCFCDIVTKVCLIFMFLWNCYSRYCCLCCHYYFGGLSASKTKKSTMVTLHWCRKLLQCFIALSVNGLVCKFCKIVELISFFSYCRHCPAQMWRMW